MAPRSIPCTSSRLAGTTFFFEVLPLSHQQVYPSIVHRRLSFPASLSGRLVLATPPLPDQHACHTTNSVYSCHAAFSNFSALQVSDAAGARCARLTLFSCLKSDTIRARFSNLLSRACNIGTRATKHPILNRAQYTGYCNAFRAIHMVGRHSTADQVEHVNDAGR